MNPILITSLVQIIVKKICTSLNFELITKNLTNLILSTD